MSHYNEVEELIENLDPSRTSVRVASTLRELAELFDDVQLAFETIDAEDVEEELEEARDDALEAIVRAARAVVDEAELNR